MKILVLGSLYGDIDLINKYHAESGCDLVLLTGNIGMFYYNDITCNKKYRKSGTFYKYINGEKTFNVDVIGVSGPCENIEIVHDILTYKIKIPKFRLLWPGEKFVYNGKVGITGLGGGYSPKHFNEVGVKRQNKYFTDEQFRKAAANGETNIVLTHELAGDFIGRKNIDFSQNQLAFFNTTNALYYFAGRYEQWLHVEYPRPVVPMNFISLPRACSGYGVLDTDCYKFNGVNNMVMEIK